MNSKDVGRYWDDNAKAWTKLVRAGYDVYRDGQNRYWSDSVDLSRIKSWQPNIITNISHHSVEADWIGLYSVDSSISSCARPCRTSSSATIWAAI
jgi:hypothetical protein